jgi:NTE family protein
MAFHLGCLRALNDVGILQNVSTISSVSGGSIIAALYCSYPGDFRDFETRVRDLLSQGFFWPAVKTAFTTLEGLRALGTFLPLAADRFAAFLFRTLLRLIRRQRNDWLWLRESPIRRRASRTTILRRALSKEFGGRGLSDLRTDRPDLIIIACELRAKAAFYFTAKKLHCWRYGSSSSHLVEIADAVSASAAYPAFLPAIDESMTFEKNGQTSVFRVTLSDGGVYDNLGLAPLWPGRDPAISLDVGSFDRIIACRAGYALEVADPASTLLSRMNSAFESIFARAQNLSMNRLYDLQRSGEIAGFLIPYLGQKDSQLHFAPADLVLEATVAGYPTNLSYMEAEWIDRLSMRGEQLVHALLKENWPEVLVTSDQTNPEASAS